MSVTADVLVSPKLRVTSRWEQIGNVAVLFAYASVVLFTVRFHEKWADEAQAWLIARDLPLRTIWFHELRYEGSPGLWHTILFVFQHSFHCNYDALSYIGACFAIAGVAFLLYGTPFPALVRWMMCFSYFIVYQYAVVARSYVLFTLLALYAAKQFRRRPSIFALALVPLALITAHGSLLAAGLAASYAWNAVRCWRTQSLSARREFILATVAIAALYVGLFLVLRPAPDVEATHGAALTSKVVGQRLIRGISGALLDQPALSVLVFATFAFWCVSRSSALAFALPVTFVLALYVYADGWAHQLGTIFIAILVALSIAWPQVDERNALNQSGEWAYRAMLCALYVTLGYQIYAASYVIKRDVRLPYCGADDMARFLKPLVAQGKTIDGYQYGMVAINAQFDHNIFANWPRAYYHHSVNEFNFALVADQMRESSSDCVITNWWDQFDQTQFEYGLRKPLESWGYSLQHASDGFLFTKTGYSNRQIYFAFCRVH